MIVYIDSDFRCHVSDTGGLTAVETAYFDEKCETMIDGYRFIPYGETWIREDGAVFRGEMIAPLRNYNELTAAQGEYVKAEGTIKTISAAGAAQVKALCIATESAPDADTGVFIRGVEPWEAGKTYSRYDLVEYKGAIAYVKQPSVTAQEIYPPFSVGTEALYGARPAPDRGGIFPYVYNMAAKVGMKVREGGKVYECIQKINDMLFPPSQLAAHFQLIS